jgi:ribonuclease HII
VSSSSPTAKSSQAKKKKLAKRPSARRLFQFDRAFGVRFIAGADEAGRGSLAGPLVAAAVLFDYEKIGPAEVRLLAGLNDSKQQDPEERAALYPLVLRVAKQVAVTARCVRGIDERGLHVTNLAGLREMLVRVACPGALCLSDGFSVGEIPFERKAVVGGDAKSAAIAAASIVAKVSRDRYMHKIAEQYPEWNFESHVGYSTPTHRDTIQRLGVTPLLRMSFASVAYQQLEITADE